jgi:predicted acylesterase/phospholipase RssA
LLGLHLNKHSIVISGGGPAGIAYGGVLKGLELINNDNSKNIHAIASASVGSIAASMLAL